MAVVFVFTSHEDLGATGKKTGWYLPEAAHPWKVFADANVPVEFASPLGGKAPLDPGSAEAFAADPVCQEFLAVNSVRLENTTKLSEINPQDVSIVFYVGGHGPMFDLATDQTSLALIRSVYENGGVVGAVCHGPAALVNATLSDGTPLVHNKNVTGFTNQEEDIVQLTQAMPFLLETSLVQKGAHFHAADAPFGAKVVVDERLVTGQNPASASGVGEALLKLRRQ
eukprot:TRINITY_DN1150_c0_g1_i1.p1 TRINITY_DN1150_c0_g1~~TRINITY_DN1150_c0_g1_i1.p1  ORF type:complete len:226 (-),score=98.33 TRINITY_DN1150_c0_g1_i1:41-718(-)